MSPRPWLGGPVSRERLRSPRARMSVSWAGVRRRCCQAVPGGFFDNSNAAFPADFKPLPGPAGVTFSGRAFSEPRLLALAYAFEQATKYRVSSQTTPPLPSDSVRRP